MTARVGDVIETAEQLEALPVGSVVLASTGKAYQRARDGGGGHGYGVVWAEAGEEYLTQPFTMVRWAPLTVLHVPGCEHGTLDHEDLVERLADTLAYYHCRSVNPKADSPHMGYHAFSEDQREFLRDKQREAAEEIARMWAKGMKKPGQEPRALPSRDEIARLVWECATTPCGTCPEGSVDWVTCCVYCTDEAEGIADAVLALPHQPHGRDVEAEINEAYRRGHEDGFWNGKTTDMNPVDAAKAMAPYRATGGVR